MFHLFLQLRISVCFRDCLRHELDALTSSGVRYTVSTPMQRRDPAQSTIIRRFEFSRIESIRVFISNLPVRVCTLSKDAFGSSELRFSRLFNVQKLWCLILYAKINQKDKKEWYSFRPIFQIRWNWSISNWI